MEPIVKIMPLQKSLAAKPLEDNTSVKQADFCAYNGDCLKEVALYGNSVITF